MDVGACSPSFPSLLASRSRFALLILSSTETFGGGGAVDPPQQPPPCLPLLAELINESGNISITSPSYSTEASSFSFCRVSAFAVRCLSFPSTPLAMCGIFFTSCLENLKIYCKTKNHPARSILPVKASPLYYIHNKTQHSLQ